MSCDVSDKCLTFLAGDFPSCNECRYNENGNGGSKSYHSPLDGLEHPLKNTKNKRAVVNKKAAKSEREGASRGVKLTVNSGRKHQDGDMAYNDFGIDNKLQSTTISPKIDFEELDKIKKQARNSGKRIGVLRLENSEGRACFVIDEEDFYRVF